MNQILLTGSELLFLGILSRRGECTLSTISKDYGFITEKLSSPNFPSVYILAEGMKKFELIKVVKSSSSKLTRYQITKTGTSVMEINLKKLITDSRESSDEFKIALSISDLIKTKEMIELLTLRKNNLLERFEQLREVPAEIKDQKYFYKAFYKYPKQVIEVETRFINDTIKELKADNEIQLNLLISE